MHSQDKESELDARIRGLQAYLTSVRKGADEGLSEIQDLAHPEALSRRLQILLEAERFGEAAALVRDTPLKPEWVDRAVAAFVANGERGKANDAITWASKSVPAVKWHRCIMRYVERAHEFALRPHKGRTVHADLLTEEQKKALFDLLRVAQPLLTTVLTRSSIESGLEERVLLISAHAFGLTGDKNKAAETVGLLLDRTPPPLEAAQFCLDGFATPQPNLSARLRVEHPKSFKAKLLACLVDANLFDKNEEAFEACLQLADQASSSSDQRDLCGVLTELAQTLGTSQMKRVEELAPSLLQDGDRFLKTLHGMALLREGRVYEAGQRFTEIRDDADPYWLQANASYLNAAGKKDEAIDCLLKASKIFSHPQVLRRLSLLAFEQNRLTEAKEALERLLLIEGENIEICRNLAIIYTRLCEWKGAADQFAVLRRLEPNNPWHGPNQASALARDGDAKASLRVYDELCSSVDPSIAFLLSRAELLRQIDGAEKAFESIAAFREKHWENPLFVSVYHALGYAADQEELAHEAFIQLRLLQLAGKAPPDVLEEKSLDDVVQLFKQHGDTVEMVNRNLIEGKMPWLMGESMLGTVSYWAWRVRTQQLNWVSDEPIARAQQCIYATNGFEIRSDGQKKPRLFSMKCPPKGTPVVVDLSGLITLHRLDLLPQAAGYFGRILYPSSYETLYLRETSSLAPHQPSRQRALLQIKNAAEDKTLKVFDAVGSAELHAIRRVEEHTLDEDTAHYYRLTDIVSVLDDRGYGTDTERSKIRKIAHRPSGIGGDHPTLEIASALLIGRSTLESLSQIGGLDVVLRAFDVHITRQDFDEVIAGVHAFGIREQVRSWYIDMWTTIRSNPLFVPALYRIPQGFDEPKFREHHDESLSAAFLAESEKLPLLVDDRCCQTLILAQRRGAEYSSFGSDRLVEELAKGGVIPWSRAADSFVQLTAFRYRFLTPSVQVLKAMADRNRNSLPGEELRRVALYVHDCMRDAGLFAGFEATDPPVSIATRLYQKWLNRIGAFLADVWLDNEYSNDQAAKLTDWAMKEFLPSPPRNLGPAARVLCELTPRSVLTQAIIHLVTSRDYQKAQNCLRSIAAGMDLTETEAITIGLEVLDEI